MPDIYLHNTLTGSKELFVPVNPECVTIYVCGPTVYDLAHIGNARPPVVFDVLVRLLSAAYPAVKYVANITDIDDKINAAAAENSETIAELTQRFSEAYLQDIDSLGARKAHLYPRATHHIDAILAMIEVLIEKGHAYPSKGHVLFHVPSDPNYGELSKRSLDEMIDGARVEVADYKRDPKDFVLWKPSSADLPGWDSPWGRGRPGWHIECSAMIHQHLGTTIDIHGGGSDLMFPHHENESAQSRCAHQTSVFARYWMHSGMLNFGGEKMSKSLGNIQSIRSLTEQHQGEVLRYALLSGQYRSTLNWSDEQIGQARASLDGLYQVLRDFDYAEPSATANYAEQPIDAFPASVIQPLCDDLNTPQALAALHGAAAELRRCDNDEARARCADTLRSGGWLLGLLQQNAESYFTQATGRASDKTLSAQEIEGHIAARKAARANKEFSKADAIRDELLALGIELEDSREGTRWRRQ
tara:strand:- start:2067 stop:3482 length:1416 start_codon:yes stop_codon:yes gene_type:complete